MSRLPEQIVALSFPISNRWYNGTTYCTGKTATREVADDIQPLVSSFIQLDLDENMNTVYEVRTVYCYNKRLGQDVQVWHEFCKVTMPTMKLALNECESQCREAYSFALESGISQVLNAVTA